MRSPSYGISQAIDRAAEESARVAADLVASRS